VLTTGKERVNQSLGIRRREKNLLRGKQSDDGGRNREEDNEPDQMEEAATGKRRKQARRENTQKGEEKIACWTRRRIRLFENPWVREGGSGQQERDEGGLFYMIMSMGERPTGSRHSQ